MQLTFSDQHYGTETPILTSGATGSFEVMITQVGLAFGTSHSGNSNSISFFGRTLPKLEKLVCSGAVTFRPVCGLVGGKRGKVGGKGPLST